MNNPKPRGHKQAERDLTERLLSDRGLYGQYSVDKIESLIPNHEQQDELAGIRGYLAFTAAADRNTPHLEQKYALLANEAIRHLAVWKFVCDFYQLSPGIRNSVDCKPSLHRVGTTSFVIRLEGVNGEMLALKLLKYRFCFKPSITDANRVASRPPHCTHWKQGDRYIEMSFIEGDTLADLFKLHSRKVRANCAELALNLCKELEIAKRVHGDLNPHNVIVVADSSGCEIRLIDFGVNNLIREGVGDADTIVRASVYLAPEVIEQPEATLLGDVYAFGVILLEMLSAGISKHEDVSRRRIVVNARSKSTGTRWENGKEKHLQRDGFDRLIEGIQSESPGLAALLDDMLEEDPRLRFGAGQQAEEVFELLSKRLELEFILRSERLARKRVSPLRRLATMTFGLLSGDPTGFVADQLGEAKRLESFAKENEYTDTRRDLSYLMNWSLVSAISHLIVVAGFVFFIQKYSSEFGRLNSALPGMLIMLSFSFVAVKYYQSIFGEIDVRDLGQPARLASIWIRFCSFYWPPAILLGYYFSPEHWSIAVFYGTGVVALNNYLVWRLASAAVNELSNANLGTPVSVVAWLNAFKGWYELMALYAILMLVIGQLILYGYLRDVEAFTAIILIVNFKLWFYNSTRIAPPIRNSLLRIFQRYRRLLIFRSGGEGTRDLP